MLGPFEETGHGSRIQHDPSALTEHGETWRPTSTIHLLTIWHGAHPNTPMHLGVKFLSVHEPTRRNSAVAPHVLMRHG